MLRRDDVTNYGSVSEDKRDTPKVPNSDSEIKSESASFYLYSFISNFTKSSTISVSEQAVLHPAIPQLRAIIRKIQSDYLWRQNALASESILIQLLKTLASNNYAEVTPEAKKEIMNILEPPLTRGIFSTNSATIIKGHISAINAPSTPPQQANKETAFSYLSFP